MTNADVYMFANELKKINPDKKDDIRVSGFDVVIYTGGNPAELIAPYPFVWVEEEQAFSDLPTLKHLGEPLVFQSFFVRCQRRE